MKIKCANEACRIERSNHFWVVGSDAYCSPWCHRNKGQHPNTAGQYKKLWLSLRKEKKHQS
jgi:hypothetical protein